MTLEELQEIMREHLNIEAEEVTLDSSFVSLGIDSLDTVEMVMEIEERLDIELEMKEKIYTVRELLNLIQTKVA